MKNSSTLWNGRLGSWWFINYNIFPLPFSNRFSVAKKNKNKIKLQRTMLGLDRKGFHSANKKVLHIAGGNFCFLEWVLWWANFSFHKWNGSSVHEQSTDLGIRPRKKQANHCIFQYQQNRSMRTAERQFLKPLHAWGDRFVSYQGFKGHQICLN